MRRRLKVLVDAANERLLSAAILGFNGDEVVHSLLDVLAIDRRYTVLSRAVQFAASHKTHVVTSYWIAGKSTAVSIDR